MTKQRSVEARMDQDRLQAADTDESLLRKWNPALWIWHVSDISYAWGSVNASWREVQDDKRKIKRRKIRFKSQNNIQVLFSAQQ